MKYIFGTQSSEDNHSNMVFRVSPRVFRSLMLTGKLHLEWKSVSIKKFTLLTKCYKCHGHGHISKHCTGEETCGHCAGNHRTSSCDARYPTCAMCWVSPKFTQHAHTHSATNTAQCPTMDYLKHLIDSHTDFGTNISTYPHNG